MKHILTFCYALLCLSCSSQTAPTVKSSNVAMVKDNEPGKPFTLVVSILDVKSQQPIADVEVFAYQTNAKGDYENDSKGVARIHATAYTNEKGKVTFKTIYPRGYNDSPSGEHIHFKIKAKGYSDDSPTLDFDAKNNSSIQTGKVYLNQMNDKDGKMSGEATIYLKKN
jgi:protocatechuate 3,4-dioxygenase beta subunit